jgi:3-hydroxyisobutyrate dehydrogenase-like beta-hydroxyacid dehydrogenase
MADAMKLGFAGIGIMGVHMARRLAEAGHAVTAWNRTREKAERLGEFGVRVAESAAETGAGADAVIVMVADGPSSDAVIFGAEGGEGILDKMARDATLVVMSSIPPDTAAAQGAAAAKKGIRYLDAPVSGGEGGARDGTLAIMAGGDASAFEALKPVFSVMGRATHVGPAGAGSLAKLANQVIVGNTIQTVAEALLLAQKGGADPGAVIEALKGGFADSPILQNHGRRMIGGDFTPGGRCAIQLKDTRTAEELGQALGLELPVTSLVRQVYAALVEAGDGDLDHNAAWLALLRRNGLDAP